jgi:hypothetical protein
MLPTNLQMVKTPIAKERDHLKMTGPTGSNQRRRSRNYDNYSSHNQVVAGYMENNNQGDERQNSGYPTTTEMTRVTTGNSGQEL